MNSFLLKMPVPLLTFLLAFWGKKKDSSSTSNHIYKAMKQGRWLSCRRVCVRECFSPSGISFWQWVILLGPREIRNKANVHDLISSVRLCLKSDQVMTPMRSQLDNLLLPLLGCS